MAWLVRHFQLRGMLSGGLSGGKRGAAANRSTSGSVLSRGQAHLTVSPLSLRFQSNLDSSFTLNLLGRRRGRLPTSIYLVRKITLGKACERLILQKLKILESGGLKVAGCQ